MGACTRTEKPDETSYGMPVCFNTPVIGALSKAPVDGVEYPTDRPFKVWGYFSDALTVDPSAPGTHGQEYIPGAQCSYRQIDGAGPYYWLPFYTYDEGTETGYYYWKAGIGYMTFQALSPYDTPGVSQSWESGISVADFEVNSAVASQTDLLFTDYVSAQRSQYSSAFPYEETETDYGPDYQGVDICFKHALASVRFRFKELQKYETGDADAITIVKIELLNAFQQGCFDQNRLGGTLSPFTSAPAWTGQNTEHNFVLYEKASASEGYKLRWDDGAGEAILSEQLGATFLSIPQELDHSSQGLRQVSIRVTYTRDGNMAHTNTVAASLAGQMFHPVSDPAVVIDAWEMGIRYTYNVTVGLNKILFDPDMTNWTNQADDFIIF